MPNSCDGVTDPRCVARFRSHVAPPAPDGCELWTGGVVKNQRGTVVGRFRGGERRPSGRARVMAHRFAWELKNGPIAEGLQVLHSCDVGLCCAIRHLRLGVDADNVADRLARFANAAGGEGHGLAKLTHADAREIYAAALAGAQSQRAIAADHGISQSTVSDILRRRRRAFSTEAVA